MILDYLNDKQAFQAWAVSSVVLFALYYRWPGRKLDHIPAVGYRSHILSYIGAFQFLFNAPDVIHRGYNQYRNKIFKVPTLDRWRVVVTGTDLIEELRKVPEDVLSFHEAVNESLQIEFTLGPAISDNPYHIPIIRSQLTRNLPALFPAVQEEVAAAFSDVVSLKGNANLAEWSKFKAMDTMMPIVCRASNRIFVGAPLCRDPDYMDINIKFTITVATAGAVLNLLPAFIRPFANRFLTSVPAAIDRSIKHLGPLIEERRRNIEEYGEDYPGKPNDLLSWLIDAAEGDEMSLRSLTLRILTVNFAAIHTSTMTFCHALYYLAAHPEYLKPMREEIEEVVQRDGWSHSALNQMFKVDSFIKEIMMERVAQQPFTFSDGTYIPSGTHVCVAAHALHTDEAAYEDPYTFQPFRFADKSKLAYSGRKGDMISTSSDFVAFGHGRHACPGRFFAANELKLMLAHLAVTYDVKLEGDVTERPANMWFISNCVPNTKAEILLRKRVD
ncbi:hypothetical protein H0H81_009080 [Sphagnurus paluster]|uniref:Cytochrome P450 n=1 Tax=Sphagnurus paluster TaxID=117069 RepID=A0A9P7GQT3_9AGAR|nr:hypothetical protein H0H81_009080 [Sphagnurus paluster]